MSTNKQVAEAWANGKRARSALMYSDGVRLYSYFTCIAERYLTCIAERWGGDVIFNCTRYNVTTSGKHYPARNRVAIATKEIDGVPCGTQSLVRFMEKRASVYGSLAV